MDHHDGIKSNRHPDYAPTDEAPAEAASTASADREAATELTAAQLHTAVTRWGANGVPTPQVAYEL